MASEKEPAKKRKKPIQRRQQNRLKQLENMTVEEKRSRLAKRRERHRKKQQELRKLTKEIKKTDQKLVPTENNQQKDLEYSVPDVADATVNHITKMREDPAVSPNALMDHSTTFKDQHRQLQQLIGSEASDFRSDKATQAALRALIMSVMNAIPIAEAQFHEYKNDRAAYALNALINQSRELLGDLRGFQDLEQQVTHITTRIVQPSFTLVANMLVQELAILRETISTQLQPTASAKETVTTQINTLLRDYSKYLGEMVKDIEGKLKTYLIDQTQTSKPTKTRTSR